MADLIAFWDASCRSWIVYAVDAEGHQLWAADYYANRESLRLSFTQGDIPS